MLIYSYGYYLVDDCALFVFDSDAFCYYLSPADISDHTNVSLILSDNIIGETFSNSNVGGRAFKIWIEPLADHNYVNVSGTHNSFRINGVQYAESVFSCQEQKIITRRQETTGGYRYLSNVNLGDIISWSNLAENEVWFSISPKGVDYIHIP